MLLMISEQNSTDSFLGMELKRACLRGQPSPSFFTTLICLHSLCLARGLMGAPLALGGALVVFSPSSDYVVAVQRG